jgi:phosphoribosylformimino-5-aminoimidazole carboxamide ribotide isomerase
MIIIPAIDIKDGRCVRLFQGDFDKQTIYSNDPLEIALRWRDAGAKLIHVVDLNGAKDGRPENFAVIENIAKLVSIEIGGGIRSIETIRKYLEAGVVRVVLGTALLEDFDFAKKVFKLFGEKIVVALDAKKGHLMTEGWILKSGLKIKETAKKLEEIGARRIIYTDILRDGSLTHPNFESIKKLIAKVDIPIIASGGISSTNQIKKLKQMGAEGVIIGKALYVGSLNLKEALNAG